MPDIERYTVDRTQDEHGEARWFVADEHGDWIGEPFLTREAAIEEAERLRTRTMESNEHAD